MFCFLQIVEETVGKVKTEMQTLQDLICGCWKVELLEAC